MDLDTEESKLAPFSLLPPISVGIERDILFELEQPSPPVATTTTTTTSDSATTPTPLATTTTTTSMIDITGSTPRKFRSMLELVRILQERVPTVSTLDELLFYDASDSCWRVLSDRIDFDSLPNPLHVRVGSGQCDESPQQLEHQRERDAHLKHLYSLCNMHLRYRAQYRKQQLEHKISNLSVDFKKQIRVSSSGGTKRPGSSSIMKDR